jgi:hypothetical protein
MVISSSANLIPFDDRHYPVQPLMQEDTVLMTRDSIERHYRFQKPPSDRMTAGHLGNFGNRYDSNRCLQYADDYQVGHQIDVYA